MTLLWVWLSGIVPALFILWLIGQYMGRGERLPVVIAMFFSVIWPMSLVIASFAGFCIYGSRALVALIQRLDRLWDKQILFKPKKKKGYDY